MSSLSGEEIKRLYKRGKRFYSQYFVLFYLSSESKRYAVVVSKKISKKAVVRNKIKRRMRHLIKEHIHSGEFILIPKTDISNVKFQSLEDDIKKLVGKIY